VIPEQSLFMVVVALILMRGRVETNQGQQPKMVKSFAAFGIFALLGTSVIALPSFAPTVQASEAAALSKGDRLGIRAATSNCSTQVWPDFTTSCLRNTASGSIVEARFVTARR
jgi:hypothetical protein